MCNFTALAVSITDIQWQNYYRPTVSAASSVHHTDHGNQTAIWSTV